MLNNKISKAVRLAIAFGAVSTAAFSAGVNAADAAIEKDEKVEKIQVLGSRIRTDSFASDTPVDIISIEDATEQGITSLGELLRTSTVAAGSSQITSALSVGYVTSGGAGAETISMRGLGANRTLVLLNGRRAGPAGTRGQVSSFDMNALPISAIERIEVLKDGASSLYGSDAVAGVINIITKKGDDKTVSVDLNQPFESGGEQQRINFSIGEEFADGSIRVVGDYKIQHELQRGDRDFFDCTARRLYNDAGDRADPIDPRTGDYHCNDTGFGLWLSNDGATNFTSGYGSYDYDGFFANNGYTSFNDAAGAAGDFTTPEGWYNVGFDKESDGWWDKQHPFTDSESMIPETETYSFFVQGDYSFSDDVSGYAEALYSSRKTETQAYRQFWVADVARPSASSYEGFDGDVRVMPVALTDHYGGETTVDYTRFVLGLEGSLGFWNWDVSYQNSHNKGEYKNKIIYRDSMVMAQNHLANGTECSGEVTATSGKSCVNVPFADPQLLYGNPSQEVRDFLFGEETGETIYKQQTFEAYITGDLFELPAGAVGSAFGLSFQKDELDDTPGVNAANGNSWGLSSASRTVGSQNTRAVFGEIRIPLLEGKEWAERMELTTSARWTDVSSYGSDTTYKVGMTWEVVDGFTLRGSRGTSFRSPALFELYLAGQSGFLGQNSVDPCYDYGAKYEEGTVSQQTYDNCLASGVPTDYDGSTSSSATTITSGGAGRLTAETSVSEGFGFVWTSPEDTYAFSADYYQIDISNQVANLGGSDITNTCYSSENFPNEPICNQFTRKDGTDGNYGIDTIYGGYTNIASQGTRGVDLNFTFRDDFDFGSVYFDIEHTVQLERTYQLFENSEPEQYIGETGNPKHIGNISATYSKDDWSLTWTTRYVDETNRYEYYDDTNETTYRGEDVTFVADTPWVFYHSLSGNMQFEQFDFTVGIANLFDEIPPQVSPSYVRAVGNSALYSQYDNLGRRFFANITYDF